jgi:hypothetical protein
LSFVLAAAVLASVVAPPPPQEFPPNVPIDLTNVCSIALIGDRSHLTWANREQPELRAALDEWLPADVVHEPRDSAQLLIEYVAYPTDPGDSDAPPRPMYWSARLSRLGCQNPEFGRKPSPPSDCPGRVYVREQLAKWEGRAGDYDSAARDFARLLRESLLVAPR